MKLSFVAHWKVVLLGCREVKDYLCVRLSGFEEIFLTLLP